MSDSIEELRASINRCEDASGLFGVAHSLVNEIEALRARAAVPERGRLLLLVSAIRSAAVEAQDAAAAGKLEAAMQRYKAVQKLADTMTAEDAQ